MTKRYVSEVAVACGAAGVARDVVTIRSMPGCEQQPWHYDVDPLAIESLRVDNKLIPQFMLYAHQQGTTLPIRHPETNAIITIELNEDEVVIVDADVMHAGAAWGTDVPQVRPNDRTHAFLDSNVHNRSTNTTYIPDCP